MGGVASTHNCKPQSTVPAGKIRICVSGYYNSPPTGRAHQLANFLAASYPDKFESWFHWDGHGNFYRYIIDTFDKVPFATKIKGHASSPLVWLEVPKTEATGASADPCNAIDGDNAVLQVIGGNSDFQQWIKEHTMKASDSAAPCHPFTPLTEEEKSRKVAQAPNVLYFKETEELVSLWSGVSFFKDLNHWEKYGKMTAAEKNEETK